MFDIGFWEICIIAIIALIVFGPEKLPGAARTAGLWIGRIRRMVTTVRQDIDRELHLQEMRDAIQESDQNVHQFLEETKTGLNELNKPISLDSNLDSKPNEEKAEEKTEELNPKRD
ncbi:MAG TPA: twin-arginine translocase subunit TatB [Gammaproteobacteria bacterium]|nr:Sec-independent protein translocase protein TatB [Candidatus Parabeggiatoa sp.]HAI70236.1 twin-arginine translocase subunit TatB [Gammaproteobacteria bacterium]